MDESIKIKDPFLQQPGHSDEMCADMRSSLEQFEHAYLARSLSRLFDPINLMFSGSKFGFYQMLCLFQTVHVLVRGEILLISYGKAGLI